MSGPTSWRDVYSLVRDTREDVLAAVLVVDGKVTAIDGRVDDIERARNLERITAEVAATLATARNKRLLSVVAASRGGIALVISVGAFVAMLLK